MRRFIHSLRQKPESHRKRWAYGTSAVITLVIAGVWATSFQYFNAPASTQVAVAEVNSNNSPLNVLKNGVASAYEAITGSKVEFVKEGTDASASGTLEYVPDSPSVVATTTTEDVENTNNTTDNSNTTNGTDAGQTGSQYNF